MGSGPTGGVHGTGGADTGDPPPGWSRHGRRNDPAPHGNELDASTSGRIQVGFLPVAAPSSGLGERPPRMSVVPIPWKSRDSWPVRAHRGLLAMTAGRTALRALFASPIACLVLVLPAHPAGAAGGGGQRIVEFLKNQGTFCLPDGQEAAPSSCRECPNFLCGAFGFWRIPWSIRSRGSSNSSAPTARARPPPENASGAAGPRRGHGTRRGPRPDRRPRPGDPAPGRPTAGRPRRAHRRARPAGPS